VFQMREIHAKCVKFTLFLRVAFCHPAVFRCFCEVPFSGTGPAKENN